MNNASFSSEKRHRIALSVLGAIVGVIVIVLLLNCLGLRHFMRFHLDARDASRLSPMTEQSLKGLKEDINIVMLFDFSLTLATSIDNLLKEYSAMSPHIKVQRVDYTEDPQAAEAVKNKYRLQLPELDNETRFRDLVIFEAKDKTPRVIYEKQLSDFNINDVASGKEQQVRRVAFKGEMLFTSAIASLTENRSRVAYFSTGHREHDIEDDSETTGYSKFAEILSQNYVKIKKIHIWNEGPIPEDCSLLVIGGPREAFMDAEIAKIEEYLKNGGSMLYLLPEFGETKLEAMLKKWGVQTGSELVYDPLSTWRNNVIVTNFNAQSPISRPLFDSKMCIPMSHRISSDDSEVRAADAPQVTELFRSSSASYLIGYDEDGNPDTTKRIGDTENKEYGMAASIEKGALQGISSGKGATRIVVVGNSRFLDNLWIDTAYGNRDFVVLTLNWLLDRKQLMGGVGPRAIVEYQLNLSEKQVHLLMWIMMGIIPGIVLLSGLVVWMRRRN